MGALFTAIGLPRQIIAFRRLCLWPDARQLFGALAALLGCAVSFAYARLFGRGVLSKRLGARAQRFRCFHP